MSKEHAHKWVEIPCSLTATWSYMCMCGATKWLEIDQDGSSTTHYEPSQEAP